MELARLIDLADLNQYKLHAARYNGTSHPLDVFISDKKSWDGWNEWRGNKNDFNRQYIFSCMDFYPEPNIWLFGGVYEVIGRHDDGYDLRACDAGKDLIGRLKFELNLSRGRSFVFENWVEKIQVTEVLRKPYVAELFPGYENISLEFSKLRVIIENNRPDWRTALQNMKGVYVIADKTNGKKYVGKADGSNGIWARWQQYMDSGSGGNVELVKLLTDNRNTNPNYAFENFQMTLIEAYPWKMSDSIIDNRESFWKKALLTHRNQFGYNGN